MLALLLNGVVHDDLHMGNWIVDASNLKVIDFGLSLMLPESIIKKIRSDVRKVIVSGRNIYDENFIHSLYDTYIRSWRDVITSLRGNPRLGQNNGHKLREIYQNLLKRVP